MILKMQETNKEPSFSQIVGIGFLNEKEVLYKTITNESKKKNIENLLIFELLSDDGSLIHKYK